MHQITARIGIDSLLSRLVTESFFEAAREAIIEIEPVYIRTFGSFIPKRRVQKVARNISTNRSIIGLTD